MRLWRFGRGNLGATRGDDTGGRTAATTHTRSDDERRAANTVDSACHGMTGRGDGPAAPASRTPPADLTRLAQRRGGIPRGRCCSLTGGPSSRPMAVGRCPFGVSALGRWAGVARSARRWSAALSWSLSNTSKPSSSNATRAGHRWSRFGIASAISA